MDTAGIASFLVSSQSQQTRMNVTTAMVKMQNEQDQQILSLLGSATPSSSGQAPAPAGMGQSVDMTV